MISSEGHITPIPVEHSIEFGKNRIFKKKFNSSTKLTISTRQSKILTAIPFNYTYLDQNKILLNYLSAFTKFIIGHSQIIYFISKIAKFKTSLTF